MGIQIDKIKIPDIAESEKTPTIIQLLMIIQTLLALVQSLKDEIARLKTHSSRPKIRPSILHSDTPPDQQKPPSTASKKKRPGSAKRKKTAELAIHQTTHNKPVETVPDGSTFKGYKDIVIQNMKIEVCNTLYRREVWTTPSGENLYGPMPPGSFLHFGPELVRFILYQHYQNHVTQPLLLEHLHEIGIDISAGQLSRILIEKKDRFHQEKADILTAGLAISNYLQTDDSGARHQGKNGYVTVINNPFFAWFRSSPSKSRVNFLECLQGGDSIYRLNEKALAYMTAAKLPAKPLAIITSHQDQVITDPDEWESILDQWGIKAKRHRQIVTEGALFGHTRETNLAHNPVIHSDDAKQFDLGNNSRCWVHAERVFDRIIPVSDKQKESIMAVQTKIWRFYQTLKAYKQSPRPELKIQLWKRFDTDFTTIKGGDATLNQALERFRKNKEKLLRVLDHPNLPLHNNRSENDIRDYVKKRKISGGTRSDEGQLARDSYASLKKTCRKLDVSFWQYLLDRVSGENKILPLDQIIYQKAESQYK